jgi:hypothetical protein
MLNFKDKLRPFERFSVSKESDCECTIPSKESFIFLYVPYVDDPDHYHISISLDEAKQLKDWLNKNV